MAYKGFKHGTRVVIISDINNSYCHFSVHCIVLNGGKCATKLQEHFFYVRPLI